MATLVLILMILSGILFIGSVLLMTPKGGIGFGIGGMATSNEYGSKKSVESTLKKTALVSIVVFTGCALVYPYLNKSSLSTGKALPTQTQTQSQEIKLTPSDVKIKTEKSEPVQIKVSPTEQTTENK
jgi:protein translocase SecG subunit